MKNSSGGVDVYRFVGGRVREEREKAGLTQAELAQRARVHHSFIGYIERAEKKASLETLARLCAALNITISGLFAQSKGGPGRQAFRDMRINRIFEDLSAHERSLVLRLLTIIKTARGKKAA